MPTLPLSRRGRKTYPRMALKGTPAAPDAAAPAPPEPAPAPSRKAFTEADLDRPAAARFSFLLSTPAIGGAALVACMDLIEQGGIAPEMRTAFALGIALSGISGIAVIAFLINFLRRRSLRFFILYRVIFGIIVIALALFRRPAG